MCRSLGKSLASGLSKESALANALKSAAAEERALASRATSTSGAGPMGGGGAVATVIKG